jgi:hypothetical protein
MSDPRFIALVSFLFITCQLSAQAPAETDGYTIVRQDEKITMYERWLPYPGTTISSRQIKCVFQANVEPSKMVGYLYEEAKIKTWQENILEYIITPKNDSVWVAYSYYRIPWPLDNQDYLLQYAVQKKNENKIVLNFTHLEDEKLGALRKGVDRRPTTGKWELEKVGNAKTKITYTITSLPLNTPRFITDRIVHNSLMNTIHKLILVAEK